MSSSSRYTLVFVTRWRRDLRRTESRHQVIPRSFRTGSMMLVKKISAASGRRLACTSFMIPQKTVCPSRPPNQTIVLIGKTLAGR